MASSGWQNRIIGYGVKAADQFLVNPKNWRRHPVSQQGVMRSALDKVGWIGVVIENAQTGELIDGHERIWEALDNNNAEVPFIQVDLTSEEQDIALATYDVIGHMAVTDDDMLAALLNDIKAGDEGLSELVASLAAEMDVTLDGVEPPDDPGAQLDRAAELQVKWQTARGQVWEIGPHRLMCGDSTSREDVERLMDGVRAQLVVTDPPYGVNYEPAWRGEDLDQTVHGGAIQGDGDFEWIRAFEHIPADVLYVWLASNWLARVQFGIEQYGFVTRYLIIWNKDLAVFGRGNYHWKHEPCLYMVRKGARANWQGARDQSSVWDIPTIHSFKNGHNSEEWGLVGHATQKPIECMTRPISNNSALGEIVYDPFLGSGTTAVAAEQTGRICYGMEIDPGYTAVSIERLTQMGLEAWLVDGLES